MTRRLVTSAVLAAFTAAALAVPAAAQKNSKGGLTVPFTASGTDSAGQTTDVNGTLTIDRFVKRGGAIFAVGTIVASDGSKVGVTRAEVPVELTGGETSSPVALQQVACGILHLELGPLDLDLLGLVVHLDQVVLDISADPGPGNLLGNLLCSLAGLLDSGPLAGLLDQVVALLNQILGAL